MLRLLAVLLTLAFLLPAGAALAAPADVDPGFGRDGRATLKYDGVVARVLPGGAPDPSFGRDGVAMLETVHTDYLYASPTARSWPPATRRPGRTASSGASTPTARRTRASAPTAARSSTAPATNTSRRWRSSPTAGSCSSGHTSVNEDIAVYRLTAAGKPDTTFDFDGARGIDGGGKEKAYGVALQADGKIVVTGYSWTNAVRPLVARLGPTAFPATAWSPSTAVTRRTPARSRSSRTARSSWAERRMPATTRSSGASTPTAPVTRASAPRAS